MHRHYGHYGKIAVAIIGLGLMPACSAEPEIDPNAAVDTELGLRLPAGFTATVFADNLGYARHMAVRSDGALYVARRRSDDGMGIVALKDTNGDGVADVQEAFADMLGTGIGFYQEQLYFSTPTAVYRYRFNGDELTPSSGPEEMMTFLSQRQHASKPFTFDGKGNIYVNVGGPSNACQQEMRTPGSPGVDPCPQLDLQGGIWRFDATKPGQNIQTDGHRYATGIRNAMGLDWNFDTNNLYFITHGRDSLSTLWPDIFTDEESAELPAEEFHMASDGSNHGWPYGYWNHLTGKRILSPEYGGDGKQEIEAAKYKAPLVGFPGHWAPNDLIFYTGAGLPDYYKGGAFVAFHGSWNRAPLPQAGYKVVFIPFEKGEASSEWSVFADGFSGSNNLASPGDAVHRPMGLAQGADGELYISDSVQGRIWKVVYDGQ